MGAVKVRYEGDGTHGIALGDARVVCENGTEILVSEEIAAELVGQGFVLVQQKRATAPITRPASSAPTERIGHSDSDDGVKETGPAPSAPTPRRRTRRKKG